jgi:hypothetical protein
MSYEGCMTNFPKLYLGVACRLNKAHKINNVKSVSNEYGRRNSNYYKLFTVISKKGNLSYTRYELEFL